MAKETGEHGSKAEGQGKKKKMHLHEIRSTQAHDGSIIHHHVYKESEDHPYTMPERGPMATSSTPDEAGQHVAEQFAMNGGGGEAAAGGGEPEAAGGEAQPGA